MKESIIALISYFLFSVLITLFIYKSIRSERYSMRGVAKIVKVVVVVLRCFIIIFGVISTLVAIPSTVIIFSGSQLGTKVFENISWNVRGYDIDFILLAILVLVIPYASYLIYLILRKLEIIFESLSKGIVFCDKIYDALKSISLFVALLLPLSMVEISNLDTMQHTTINITILPIIYIFLVYIIQLVYKEALKIYNENRLTI
ncbi:hypothetical protein RI065_00450 [Mycoplasmatota bacterium zrk1]